MHFKKTFETRMKGGSEGTFNIARIAKSAKIAEI